MRRFFTLNIAFLIVTVIYNSAAAYSGWDARLPNGSYIQTGSKTRCQICHEYANPLTDPVTRNAFGSDFLAAGSAWNQTLGTKDSDGDTYSNAAELQCYNFAWTGGPCGSDQAYVANPGDFFITPKIAAEKAPLVEMGDMLSAMPNPFNSETAIAFSLAGPNRAAEMRIFGPSGKLVRVLPVSGASGRVAWQGTDGNGNPAPSGLYMARMVSGKKTLTARLVLSR